MKIKQNHHSRRPTRPMDAVAVGVADSRRSRRPASGSGPPWGDLDPPTSPGGLFEAQFFGNEWASAGVIAGALVGLAHRSEVWWVAYGTGLLLPIPRPAQAVSALHRGRGVASAIGGVWASYPTLRADRVGRPVPSHTCMDSRRISPPRPTATASMGRGSPRVWLFDLSYVLSLVCSQPWWAAVQSAFRALGQPRLPTLFLKPFEEVRPATREVGL